MGAIDTVFKIYVLCAGVLVFNLLFLANGTALIRARSGKYRNPEDAKFNKNGQLQEDDEGMTARWRRAHLNALENILPFLPIGFLFVMTGPSALLAGLLIGGFTALRLLHSVAYVKAMQPARTIGFGGAALILAGMVIFVSVKVLTA